MSELVVRITWFPIWHSTDCELYPYYLSQLDEDVTLRAGDVGPVLFGRPVKTPSGTQADRNRMRNVFGVELKDSNTVSLRGLHLLEPLPGQAGMYRLSEPARRLRKVYIEQGNWKAELAAILLQFHPRVRAVLLPMARENWYLRSNRGASNPFSHPIPETVLWDPQQAQPYSFMQDPVSGKESGLQGSWEADINRLLVRNPAATVGPWVLKIASDHGVDTDRPIRIQSSHGGAPSTKNLHAGLRYALQVLYDLGLLRYRATTSGWHFDSREAERLLGHELLDDLAQGAMPETAEPVEVVLYQIYRAAIGPSGWVTMAGLSTALAEREGITEGAAYREVTRMIATAISEGNLEIEDHMRGMPADGPGYRGRTDYQRMTLRFAKMH